MKNIALVTFAMLLALTAGAQHKNKKKAPAKAPEPRVWIPNISDYHTTREAICANPMLITDSVGCKVSGFTISLQAPGHDFYGPLWANGNEFTDVQKGVIKSWAYPGVKVYIQNIHLNCHETDATSTELLYYFDN